MGKTEYLSQLRALLMGRMPPEELEGIVSYYEVYFDEAGPAEEGRVICELGTPAELVQQVLGHGPAVQVEAPPRKGLGTPWAVLLAVCAAPVAIPLLIVALALALGLVILALGVMLGIAAGGVACIVGGIVLGLRGFFVLFSAGLPTTIYFAGMGLLGCGVGVLLIVGAGFLEKLCFRGIGALLSRMFRRKEVQA